MANGTAEIRSILKDVTITGSIIVSKKKLLWLLGWGQDRDGAWKDLLAHWKELGESEDSLIGSEVWSNIILTMKVDGSPEPITKWAGN